MYNIALVDTTKCIAEKGCRLCIMYCPEANTINMNKTSMKAEVVTARCKGCELCAVVCSTHHAITMYPVDAATGEILLHGRAGEPASLGQAYAG